MVEGGADLYMAIFNPGGDSAIRVSHCTGWEAQDFAEEEVDR